MLAQFNPPQELHYNYLGVKDGLPEGRATAILQDKEGFMWIGTQNGLVRYDGYRIKKYNLILKDVGSVHINIIFEDTITDLWIGTDHGLFFYNRLTDAFSKYNLPNEKSDYDYSINGIQKDNHNHLWMLFNNSITGTNGMFLLNTKTKQLTVFSNKEKGSYYLSASNFYGYTIDKRDRVWIGSDTCLLEYKPKLKKIIKHYLNNDTAHSKILIFLRSDSTSMDALWFTVVDAKSKKFEGLRKYNIATNTIKIYRHVPGDSSSIISDTTIAISSDSKHRLWFGTTNGLALYNPLADNFSNYNMKDKKGNVFDNIVISINENNQGNFWCMTGKGIVYFDTYSHAFYRDTVTANTEDGLLSNSILNLMIDKAGTPWWGVAQMGVQWINKSRSRFTAYKKNTGQLYNFPGGEAYSFAENKDGNFWIGSEHGLYYWQPAIDSFKQIDFLKNGVKNSSVSAVMLDDKGNLWFNASENEHNIGGLYWYNITTHNLKNYRSKPGDSTSLSNNYVTKIVQDNSGVMWVGTGGGGLCRFNSQSQNFTRYPYIQNNNVTIPKTDSLDDDYIETIYYDKNGVLWIGTNSGALSRFNPQTSRFISYLNKLPGLNCVVNIYNDKEGRLWAGTYESGLFKINEKTNTITKLSEKDGLLYEGNWGSNEDKHGNIWLASPRGLSILNPQTNKVRTITSENGLPQFPSTANDDLYKTSKGLFLFGTKDGFIQLNPDDFVPDTTVPIMHIETVAFNNPQSNSNFTKDSSIVRYGKDKINLKYNENRITFSYVGLLYQNTQAIQYAYKLDGYDKSWVQAGTQRTTTYTNLSPGTYTFHVKAANGDGVWTTKEDAITVIISPPWWRTWWAYLMYAVAFLAALRAYVVFRSRTLRRQNKLLEEKVERRTHQLSEANEELKVSQENIAAQRDELSTTVDMLKSTQAQLIQSEKMASLGELTAGIAHEIQNPLNFVNNFSELNKELLHELKGEVDKGNIDEVKAIANDVIDNEEKINHHGKRADAIVKGMLQHSRQTKGVKELTNLNALCDEFLRLSYHGLRAKDKSFNADFTTDFDERISKINLVPQDMGRVLLNLFNNAFYAVNEKSKTANENYKPLVSIQTKTLSDAIEIIISDNGNGIPQSISNKIFQPFFTTKPTGQGTGLGLSLSYDIITKEHNGILQVESKEKEGSVFIIQLPITT